MVIKDLSNFEDIPESNLAVVGAGGYVISNAFFLGSSGTSVTYGRIYRTGSTVVGQGYAVSSGSSYSESSVSVVISSGS